MKKFASPALILAMLCYLMIGAAEEFTLRSGILFGDTMETVREKEKELIEDTENSDAAPYIR